MYSLRKVIETKKLMGVSYHEFYVKSNEIQALVFSIKLENSSAGISAGNPCTVQLQTSWDDGTSWEVVTYNFDAITGDGVFRGKPTPQTPRIGPKCRLVFTVPANESTIVTIWRPFLDTYDSYTFISNDLSVTASTGYEVDGVDTRVSLNTTLPANNKPLPTELYSGQGEGPLAKTLNTSKFMVTSATKVLPTTPLVAWDPSSSAHAELQVNSSGSLETSVTFDNQGSTTSPKQSSNPADNRGIPVVLLADQGKAPVTTNLTGNAPLEFTTNTEVLKQVMVAFDSSALKHSEVRTRGGYLQTFDKPFKVLTPYYRDYSSSNLPSSGWTEVVSSSPEAVLLVQSFDSSGEAVQVATGDAGAEVVIGYLPPGGGEFPCDLPAGSRVAIRPLGVSDITVGMLLLHVIGG